MVSAIWARRLKKLIAQRGGAKKNRGHAPNFQPALEALEERDLPSLFGNAANFAVGGSAERVLVADLNNDGKLDLGVGSRSRSTASVLLGDGAGGFGNPRS